MDQELEEAVAVYRKLLTRRRQSRFFTSWAGTVDLLRMGIRETEKELAAAERRYLEKPE